MSALSSSIFRGGSTPPLAVRNVVHGGIRSLVAIGGVAFAITMVLLQLGFLQAVRITATDIFEQVDFDIVIIPRTYDQFYAAGVFPRERLHQALGVSGVRNAAPLYARFALWRCPPYPVDRPLDVDDDAPEPNARSRSYAKRTECCWTKCPTSTSDGHWSGHSKSGKWNKPQ